MYHKTEGLVLREVLYQDADKLLSVLTRDQGLLTLRARGVRARTSRIRGACQLLCYSEFTYFEERGKASIREAQPIEQFSGLRSDLEKLALASYFAQLAETVSQEDFPTGELMTLTLNALYALSYLDYSQDQIKAAYELRLACLAGFQPQLEECPFCGSETPDCFNVTQGTVQCKDCAKEGEGLRMPMSPGTREAMRYITMQQLKKLFSFSVSESVLHELSGICETFLAAQFERGFSALDFYKSLRIE